MLTESSRRVVLFLGPEYAFRTTAALFDESIQFIYCDEFEFLDKICEASAIIDASLKVPITNELVSRASNLRIISTATTGSDHIQREEVDRRGIIVRTLKEDREFLLNITSAAEHTWSIVLALARNLILANEEVQKGEWSRENVPGYMLYGKTLGIIGCGRIGEWVSRYGNAFGMSIVAYDPYRDSWPSYIVNTTLDDVMVKSDIISIHVHLNDETRGLVSRQILDKVKQGTVIVNTSRSGVMDESALLDGLQTGRIGGAGLDVLSGEPNIGNNPLLNYARHNHNLVITPHCAGYSPEAVQIVCRRAAEKVIDCLKNSL